MSVLLLQFLLLCEGFCVVVEGCFGGFDVELEVVVFVFWCFVDYYCEVIVCVF